MADNTAQTSRRTLGRTGLSVSRIGLGGGGPSCLGRKQGRSDAEAVRLVQRAFDLGINFVDTSQRNGTEDIIGRAIRGCNRDGLVLSTKATVSDGGKLHSPREFAAAIDSSLRTLGTPYIDIMHFHGVLPQEYDYVVAELLPVMEGFRDAGKLRYIGLTEIFDRDREHAMLRRALKDDYWDAMMVGFNLVNQSARESVLVPAAEKDIGLLGMFAVRRALVSAETFTGVLQDLQSRGQLPAGLDVAATVEQLCCAEGEHGAMTSIAYRYCRDEPAIHCVLAGTGDTGHLEQNVQAFCAPPLSVTARRLIDATFGGVADFSGN